MSYGAHHPTKRPAESGSEMHRESVYVVVLGVIGAVGLAVFIEVQERRALGDLLDARARRVEARIRETMLTQLVEIDRAASRWEAPDTPRGVFEADVAARRADTPHFEAIALVDRSRDEIWAAPGAASGSSPALDCHAGTPASLGEDAARGFFTEATVGLADGSTGICYVVPAGPRRYVVAAASLPKLAAAVVPEDERPDLVLGLAYGDSTVTLGAADQADLSQARRFEIDLPGRRPWSLEVTPLHSFVSAHRSAAGVWVLVVGLVLTLLVERGATARRRERRTALELDRLGAELGATSERLRQATRRIAERESELHGQRRAALNIAADATEARRRAEAAEEAATQHYKAIVTDSQDAIISHWTDFSILSWNRGAERLFGFSEEEVLSKEGTPFIPDEHLEDERQIVSSVLAGQRIGEYETVRRRKDGTLIDVSVKISPIYSQTGAIVGTSRIERDVTEQKRTRDELRFRNEEMEQLIYTVSHDLRSPLVTIEGFSNLIAEALDATNLDDARDSARRVARATRRLEALTRDLGKLGRLGRERAPHVPVDTTAILREVEESLKAELDQREAKLRAVSPLPVVSANGDLIQRILQNLVANALRYGCPEPGCDVRVGYVEHPGEHRFFVQDCGPGIPEAHREAVFQLFKQLNIDKGGTGLGLAIVRKAARALGGDAWVEGAPGEGATFWFSISKTTTRSVPS